MAKKKVVLKKLIIEADPVTGEFKAGLVQYQLSVLGVLSPKLYTMGTPNWFDAQDLKKILKKTKEKIEQGEQITN